MILFIKGLVIGIGKIIPGVSGALLAVNFNLYEKAISSVVNFFDDWKNNLKFLIILGSGILLAIILGSKMVMYLLNNYKFITMMFFIGLISGGTYNFGVNIKYNHKNILIIGLIVIFLLFISLGKVNYTYIIKNNFWDNIIFFIGGIIEVVSSIVPGISGTALLLVLGIYDSILLMISNLFNVNFIFNNINLYISYGIGMMISFIMGILLINYLLKKYRDTLNVIILGLCFYSILMLLIITFSINIGIIEFICGCMLLVIGLFVGCILDN